MTNGSASGRVTDTAVARALGAELRIARETLGWSREYTVSRLPSGIGERTLLAYEHGARQVTVARLVELTETLGLASSSVLAMGIQRARLDLDNLELIVDLRALLDDASPRFRATHQWAKNKLHDSPGGVATVPPVAVAELAAFLGCTPRELVLHFAKFTPEYVAGATHVRPERGLLKAPE